MPMFEQVASPAAGRWQVRQPSVHSRQVASGGANVLPAGGGADVGADAGGVGEGTGRSAAIASTGHASAKASTITEAVLRTVTTTDSSRVTTGVEPASLRSGSLRNVVQNQKFGVRKRGDGVGATVVVAEFDERGRAIERLDHSADLPAGKSFRRQIGQQRDNVENRRSIVLRAVAFCHHSTQQVTNRGICSPVRTIQIVLTTIRLFCRATGMSTRQRWP
jgi:hypothetical protein